MNPNNNPLARLSVAAMSLMLGAFAGCTTIPRAGGLAESTQAGKRLLEKAKRAHGQEAFGQLSEINVSYDGEWAGGVQFFQPVLIDYDYRKRSDERIELPSLTVHQRHFGPGGVKEVHRPRGEIQVRYDGEINEDELKDRAAAAVVDGYLMFLLGPFYLDLREAIIDEGPPATVGGRRCDQLFAIFRPGFGGSPEDRVLMAIDREDGVVRRLRFTFNALPTTQGVVADVIPENHIRIGGALFPTVFTEIIRNPLPNITVHRWRVTAFDPG